MPLNHAAIVNRIEAIMSGVQKGNSPLFKHVYPGEPLGLPVGGPYAAFWYLGRVPKFGNVRGDIEVYERYQIACYWPRQPEPSTLEAFENEIADADQALQTAFRADSTLSNGSGPPYQSSPTIDITDSAVAYGGFPATRGAAIYRSLEFELHVLDREGEPTSL